MSLPILGSDPTLYHNSTDCTYNYYQATTIIYSFSQNIYELQELYYLSDTIWTQRVIRITITTVERLVDEPEE